jgi:hypothetical protein
MWKSYIAREKREQGLPGYGGQGEPAPNKVKGRSAAGNIPTAPRPFDSCRLYLLLQRPKFIAPTSPNDVLEPSSPIGMLMLGLMLNRELNTNPVPSVSSP